MKRPSIYEAIDTERERQAQLWNRDHDWGRGDCSSRDVEPIVKVAVLSEECGEVSASVLDGQQHELRRELVQVAAVAVAWLESL